MVFRRYLSTGGELFFAGNILVKQLPRILFILSLAVLSLGGCSMFTPQLRETAPIAMPDRFSLFTEADGGPGQWWHAFGSVELNGLVNEALSGNFDIRTAAAKVKQAEAEALKAGAELAPTLDYAGSGEKSWQQTKTDNGGQASSQANTLIAGLSASYEVDLWGRLQALHTAELLEYQATREDLDAAAVTIAADVITAWVDILSVRQQITILEKQIDINQRMLKLQELRFVNGKADALAVSQQNESLAAARAILPTLQLQEEQQCNALAVLLGRAGKGDVTLHQAELPDLIPLPATGLPADLLASRPDVRSAGLRLKEADWQVSAARANRLPSMTLSADAVFSSSSMELLFSNWVSTLAASITGPLFDAGYRSAEVELARAQADQYLTTYAQTVAEAIQEVEDSLVTEKRQTEYISRLNEQLQATRVTVKDANLQYMNGQDNYLSYMSAWTSVQALERQLVTEQATLIKNRVTLYRTLGGDWTRTLLASASSNP